MNSSNSTDSRLSEMDRTISFNKWLIGKSGRTYLNVSAFLAFIYSLVSLGGALKIDIVEIVTKVSISVEVFDLLHYGIQLIFIGYVVFFSALKYTAFSNVNKVSQHENRIWEGLRLHRPNKSAPPNLLEKEKLWLGFKVGVNKTAEQFASFWLMCWIFWFIFYALLIINRAKTEIPVSVLNLANNLNGLFFIYLFMTLSTSTSKYSFWQWIRFGLAIILIFFINLILQNYKTLDFLFSLLSGLFAGLSMGAFVGSINSRTISIPVWVLLFLSLYCSIQPLYVIFVNDDIFSSEFEDSIKISQAIILSIAFILKILLFLLVTWFLQTGRIIHFIVQEGSLNYTKEDQFKVLLESSDIRDFKLMEKNNESQDDD